MVSPPVSNFPFKFKLFWQNSFWAATDMSFLWWTAFCSCDHEDKGTKDNCPYFCIWQNGRATIVTMRNIFLVLSARAMQSAVQVLSFTWVPFSHKLPAFIVEAAMTMWLNAWVHPFLLSSWWQPASLFFGQPYLWNYCGT